LTSVLRRSLEQHDWPSNRVHVTEPVFLLRHSRY